MSSDELDELTRFSTEVNQYLQQPKRAATEGCLVRETEKGSKAIAKSPSEGSEVRLMMLSVPSKLYVPLAIDMQASILMKTNESLQSVNNRPVKMLIADKSEFKRVCRSSDDGTMRLLVNICADAMCYMYTEGDTITILTRSDIVYLDGQYTILPDAKRRGTI